jgi:alkylated DNA repair dioxygenase AlkB
MSLLNEAAVSWVRPGAAVLYVPNYLPLSAQTNLQRTLERELEWTRGSLRMFGRVLPEPRLTAWCGDAAYQYSGRLLEKKPWFPALASVREQLEADLASCGLHTPCGLNHALLNWYPDGQSAMGWHRDNEPELGVRPLICSLSLGASRRFAIRPRDRARRAEQMEWSLGLGDVLVMYGDSQQDWEHAVLKTQTSVESRINITFRSVTGR